ncbi:MAG: hypothetical protein ACE5FT_05160 [Candidatus Nanoarchaeia archaeon]
MRPRLPVRIDGPQLSTTSAALLDSGADRCVIPDYVGEVLGLPKGKSIQTVGIGEAGGYESTITLTLIDQKGNKELLDQVPVYVLENVNDIVIGRKGVFTNFKITFEEYDNKFRLDRKE